MSQEELKIGEEINNYLENIKKISEKTGISIYILIPLLTLREMIIVNRQLSMIHEHLDWLYEYIEKNKK
jgi:hypothetical protein